MMGHRNPRKIPIPTGQIIKNAAGEPIGLRSVYGIHESEVYADQADKQHPSGLDRALSIEKKLSEAARATLREAGEKSDLEAVVGITDPITASDVLTEWCAAIAARSCQVTGDYEVTGSYEAPVVMAARFLYAQRMLSIPPPRAQGLDAIESIIANFLATAPCYADAYYVWRLECSGDHDKVFSKTVISDAAAAGRARTATKRNEREDIMISAVKDLIDTDMTAGKIARDRSKSINAALGEHGWPQITNKRTMIRALERIRERRARG